MASPIADFVVSLGGDGRILSTGSLSKALSKDKKLSAEMKEEKKELQKADNEVDATEPDEPAKKSDGKLVVAEEVAEGHVGWPACKIFPFASASKVSYGLRSQVVHLRSWRRFVLPLLGHFIRRFDVECSYCNVSDLVPRVLGATIRDSCSKRS